MFERTGQTKQEQLLLHPLGMRPPVSQPYLESGQHWGCSDAQCPEHIPQVLDIGRELLCPLVADARDRTQLVDVQIGGAFGDLKWSVRDT